MPCNRLLLGVPLVLLASLMFAARADTPLEQNVRTEAPTNDVPDVPIVEWSRPLWRESAGWRLGDPTPIQDAGTEASQLPPLSLPPGFRPAGRFEDGSWLVEALARVTAKRPGPLTYKAHYWRYDAAGRPIRQLTTIDRPGRFVNEAGRVSDYIVPFTSQKTVAAMGDRLWILDGRSARLDSHTIDGDPLHSYRWAVPRRSAADVWERFQRSLTRLPIEDRNVLATLSPPEWLPLYERMLSDDEGHLWLQRYQLRSERRGGQTWDVIDPERGWLGSLTAPRGFEVIRIAGGVVVGRSQDADLAADLRAWPILR